MSLENQRETVPLWAAFFAKVQRAIVWDFPGKKVMTVGWSVNIHKIITLFIVYGLMVYYGNFSPSAWVYLALHGVYGYCWLIKDFGFGDQRFRHKISALGGFNLYWLLIGWYWIIPWLFISRHVELSGPEMAIAIALHTLGVVLTIASDGQRHFTLKHKKGLMTDGLFKYTRNPNYLGEIMLYSAYAYMAQHWLAWVVLAYAIISTFIPNMLVKDASISRHPGWADYKKQSSLLIPWKLITPVAFRDLLPKPSKKEA